MLDLTEVRDAGPKGKGLFATQNIAKAKPVMDLDIPVMLAIEHDQFDLVCDYCLATECREAICSTCNLVSYCDETCKHQAWTAYHQYECAVFQNMTDEEFEPYQVRAVLRFVLLQDARRLPNNTLTETLALCNHHDKISLSLNKTYNAWTQLIKEKTKTSLATSDIFKLFCIMAHNSYGISASIKGDEDIGAELFQKFSRANHSCDGNTTIRNKKIGKLKTLNSDDSKPRAMEDDKRDACLAKQVVATRDIQAGEEITISYCDADADVPLRERREALKSWHFQCTCVRCVCEETEMEMHQLEVMDQESQMVKESLQ